MADLVDESKMNIEKTIKALAYIATPKKESN